MNATVCTVGLCAATVVFSWAGLASAGPDQPFRQVSLAGQWQVKAGSARETWWKVETADDGWAAETVPARNWSTKDLNNARYVWARRTFALTAEQAECDGLLRWGRVRWGSKVWINGREAAEHPVISRTRALLPEGALETGRNVIVIRVTGWKGLAKGPKNVPLIPAGFPSFRPEKPGGIFGSIDLELYRHVLLKDVLMMPDLNRSTVTARIRLDGVAILDGKVTITATVTPWRRTEVVGTKTTAIDLAKADEPFDLEIPIRDVIPWTPERPHLYVVRLAVTRDGRSCHSRDIRFGMREFTIENGRFRLNGKPFFIRGYNLMWQWYWTDGLYNDPKIIRNLLVDFCRGMNAVALRTHTSPPPPWWLDVCDEEGVIVLAEFPMTFNYRVWPLSPEQWAAYKQRGLVDSLAWVRSMWNRPSIFMWVPTNEARNQAAWQQRTLFNAIKQLDPTRPVMRAGEATRDIVDTHCYSGFWHGAEGDFYRFATDRARRRHAQRPLGNSEYVENFSDQRRLRWNGSTEYGRQARLVYAEFIAEQTESLRRLQYDLILPYCCSGKSTTGPPYLALRNTLAPVMASIDLFDRNFRAGATLETDVCLINDTAEPHEVTVDLILSKHDPEFGAATGYLSDSLFKTTVKRTLAPASLVRHPVKWPLPEAEGKYFLAAVCRRKGEQPVISQRIVRMLAERKPAAAPQLVVLGADAPLRTWLDGRGFAYTGGLPAGEIEADVVLVWDAKKVDAADREAAARIRKWVQGGGRLVIAEHAKWDWKDLVDFEPAKGRCSRAFWREGVQHPTRKGLPGHYFRRWNGDGGVLASRSIAGSARKQGEVLMWIERPETAVLLRLAEGRGEVLISQFALRKRILRDQPAYDPAAERVLENLIFK